jgi:hypothetical protein
MLVASVAKLKNERREIGNPGKLLPMTRINMREGGKTRGTASQHNLIEHAKYDEVPFGETVGQIFWTKNPAQDKYFFGTKGIAKTGNGRKQSVVYPLQVGRYGRVHR